MSGRSVVGWSVSRLSVDLIKPLSCSLAKIACYLHLALFYYLSIVIVDQDMSFHGQLRRVIGQICI